MRGMILAAGRGERMGAATLHTPKPLLKVGGRYLIEYSLQSMIAAGIKEVVINVSYHAEQIKQALGDGARYGVKIIYSEEAERLETGGGIFQALPLLGSEPFIVLSSDVMTDYPLQNLPRQPAGWAHLVVVENPPYHPEGDFGLRDGKLDQEAQPKRTFSNIGVYRPELFAGCKPGYFRLGNLIYAGIAQGKITGELYQGDWHNIGTMKDLEEMNLHLTGNKFLSLYPLNPRYISPAYRFALAWHALPVHALSRYFLAVLYPDSSRLPLAN